MEGPAAAGCLGCFLPSGRDVGPVGTLGVGGASEHTPVCPVPGTRHGEGGDTGAWTGPWVGCPYLGARCPYWRKGHIHVAFLGGDFAAQVPSREVGSSG